MNTIAGGSGPGAELALQTTLLGLAIAIILALVAALVGPLLIDWSGYRSVFEAEASHLIGIDMRVTGPIEARLLPSPSLTLHDIEIGRGADKLGARSLGIEFALGPLMRGEWHAAELHLAGARLRLGLDAKGHVQAPDIPINFSPDALSIDRLSIEDARVTLTDARNGGAIVLDKLWFNGEARSLAGPFSGEGAATAAGELYPFRVSTGRVNDDGAIKVHLNIDPVTHPLTIEADGALRFAAGAPSFDGTLSLARPVGIVSPRATSVTQPWRLSGKVKAGPASALMPQVELQYGSAEQAMKLTGTAEFKFGKTPRFAGVLSSRQIDLDRALGGDSGLSPPADALRSLVALAAGTFRPAIPVSLGLGIDRVTLGGETVESLRGDVSSNAGGWSLDRFEFRAPGFTKVRLSGELADGTIGLAFKGPAEIDAGDPRAFAAWVEGRAEPKQSAMRPLRLRGDLTLSSERIGIEHLAADVERKSVTGHMVYAFASDKRGARLEADLNAPELDIDGALAFGKALAAGSRLQPPQEATVDAEIGHATFAGVEARNISVRVKADGKSLHIDKFAVADFGGNSISASGRIDAEGNLPRGALTFDLDAPQTAALAALAGKIAPEAAGPLTAALERIGHAKLHAALDVAGDKDNAATARLSLAGDLDATHVDASAVAAGDWQKPAAADLKLVVKLDAPEGKALLHLAGLDRLAADGRGRGALTLDLAGPAGGTLAGSWRVTGGGLNLNSHLAVTGRRVALSGIDARLGASSIRGELALDTAAPRIDGALNADSLDAASLLASAIGLPAGAEDSKTKGWSLPSAPFAGGLMSDLTGKVTLKAQRLAVTPQLTMHEFGATMRFDKNAVAFDGIAGQLARGRYDGSIAFTSTANGVAVHSKVSLTGADAAALLRAGARPPVAGTVDVSLDFEGAGFSPAALIGSLQGSGNATLKDGALAALNPRVFDTVGRAVDNGLAPDGPHIVSAATSALESGQFPVKQAQAKIAVSAGQVRLSDLRFADNNVELTGGASFDLTDGSVDAGLTLQGPSQGDGARPSIFVALNGPLAAPARSVDVSALSGWLTLRALDNQTKRLKALELEREAQQSAPHATAAPPAPPRIKEAPALPAPLNIKPLPPPPASVGGAQH